MLQSTKHGANELINEELLRSNTLTGPIDYYYYAFSLKLNTLQYIGEYTVFAVSIPKI